MKKSGQKSCEILHQRVDSISLQETYHLLRDRILHQQQTLIFAMNIHILIELRRDQHFKKMHEQAEIIFPDGVPLLWLAQFNRSSKLIERVSGTDLTEKILTDPKNKVFLVGSQDFILKEMKRRFPKSIVGFYAPPIAREWNPAENQKIIQLVNQSAAEILLIGVGALKQERWLVDHFKKTHATIGVGVGSAFDILSGFTRRAPSILRDHGFEWGWRIWLEPRRLFGRYLSDACAMMKILLSR